MRGVLLKAHEGTTHEMAAVLDRIAAPLRVAGGIVLNRYVGGVNPAAVDVALRTGARCVWLPTVDALGHVAAFGSTGAYPAQRGAAEDTSGIGVVDDDDQLTAGVREVIALVAEHDALLATGHVSAREVQAIVPAARDAGVTRVLIQHPCFPTPALGIEALRPLVAQGAVVELTYLTVSPAWNTSTLAEAAHVLRELGGDNVVISSDAGQPHNPSPPEALRSFAQAIHEQEVTHDDVRRAVRDTPARLLGLQ